MSITSDRDGSERPVIDHGVFCPGFSAPRIGIFPAVEPTGACTCKPSEDAPVGPPLHEQADRDGDNVPSDRAEVAHPVGGLRERLDVLKRELTEQEKDTETQLNLRLKAEAEIERLRDEVQKARDEADGWAGRYEALRAEVERLRVITALPGSENYSGTPGFNAMVRAEKAEAELAEAEGNWEIERRIAIHREQQVARVEALRDEARYRNSMSADWTEIDAALRGPDPTEEPS